MDQPVSASPRVSSSRKIITILLTVVILALVGVALYFRITASQTEERLTKQQQVERTALLERSESYWLQMQARELNQLALALSWAVRSELLKENFSQIDAYLATLVRDGVYTGIFVVDPSGNVLLSTDRAVVGRPFSQLYPSIDLTASRATVSGGENGSVIAVRQLTGFNETLGTLVLIKPSLSFDPDREP